MKQALTTIAQLLGFWVPVLHATLPATEPFTGTPTNPVSANWTGRIFSFSITGSGTLRRVPTSPIPAAITRFSGTRTHLITISTPKPSWAWWGISLARWCV